MLCFLKVKLQKESYKVIDNRAESTILIMGGDCQALFNFLLNCRSCVATTGPQAGVPPTLFAPTAFQGASLQALKVNNSLFVWIRMPFKWLSLLSYKVHLYHLKLIFDCFFTHVLFSVLNIDFWKKTEKLGVLRGRYTNYRWLLHRSYIANQIFILNNKKIKQS